MPAFGPRSLGELSVNEVRDFMACSLSGLRISEALAFRIDDLELPPIRAQKVFGSLTELRESGRKDRAG